MDLPLDLLVVVIVRFNSGFFVIGSIFFIDFLRPDFPRDFPPESWAASLCIKMLMLVIVPAGIVLFKWSLLSVVFFLLVPLFTFFSAHWLTLL